MRVDVKGNILETYSHGPAATENCPTSNYNKAMEIDCFLMLPNNQVRKKSNYSDDSLIWTRLFPVNISG